ncbi:MAG: MFS transporter [Actinomycetota bacterium]
MFKPREDLQAPPDRAVLQHRAVTTLIVGQLLTGTAAGLVLPVAPLLAVEFSGSDAYAGWPVMALSLAGAFAAHPLAVLALMRGRRVALAGGLVVAAVGVVAMLLATVWGSFAVLLVGAALFGVGFAVLLQTRFAATDLATPATRGRDLSLVVWAITPGAVAGPNLIGWTAAVGSDLGLPELAGPLLFSAIGLVGGALVLAVGLRPDPLFVARLLDDAAAASPPRPDAVVVKRPSFAAGLAAIRTSPRAVVAVVTVVVAHLVMVAVMSVTPVHLQGVAGHAGASHGATLTIIGITLSLHFAGMYAFSPVIGWLADRVGRVPVLFGAIGLLATAMVVAGLGQGSVPAVSVGLLLLGLGWSSALIAGSALLGESVAGDRRVTAQGIVDTLMGLAAALGAAGSGLALQSFGFAPLNFVALALVVGLAVWGVRGLRRAPGPRLAH